MLQPQVEIGQFLAQLIGGLGAGRLGRPSGLHKACGYFCSGAAEPVGAGLGDSCLVGQWLADRLVAVVVASLGWVCLEHADLGGCFVVAVHCILYVKLAGLRATIGRRMLPASTWTAGDSRL